ncbi:hypothetical protein EV363DRAFT_1587052 [Boletus edulis]|nr:hypothetical protein EV363DRAFT_1587052 [Boletus edulis]
MSLPLDDNSSLAMSGPDHLSIPMDILVTRGSTEKFRGHDTQTTVDHATQESILDKTPAPIYRHAAPSGPWPWMDFDEDMPIVPQLPNPPTVPGSQPWTGYPQCTFPNWTETQVNRCKMLTDCPTGESNAYKVDVLHSGKFREEELEMATIRDGPSQNEFWKLVNVQRDQNIRIRAVFVKNMTKEVLQILGKRYEIEPFFFSSSTNWIPSRYQENIVAKQSDHITVVLPFIRVVPREAAGPIPPRLLQDSLVSSQQEDEQIIDTQSPLYLDSCDKYILQDLLSVHMVRNVQSSTIISIHPKSRKKTADQLHSLINRTGRSVYWSKNFVNSKDPTCLFLCFLWYAMYEWDELFETLYSHINELEQKVLNSDNIRETRHLHILQAHLLYYRNLLEDFKKSVIFVQETKNPAMDDPSITDGERARAKRIMVKETDYLLSEIERLESQRMMQVMRLKNVIDLAFASVNIDDSKYMQELTIATVRDSSAMKQIAYLTTVFLPANFMSNVFSMNIKEINPSGGETLPHYIAGAVGLTVFGMWVTVAMQVDSIFFDRGSPMWRRSLWPMFFAWKMWLQMWHKRFSLKRKTT